MFCKICSLLSQNLIVLGLGAYLIQPLVYPYLFHIEELVFEEIYYYRLFQKVGWNFFRVIFSLKYQTRDKGECRSVYPHHKQKSFSAISLPL